MKRTPASPTVPASLPARVGVDASSGLDELNLGRLTLNSAQKTVPADLRRWEKQIVTPDGRPVIVTCTAPEGEVVPHGLDNDVMVGLINLCFEAGVPDGPFVTTGYALLKAAGLPDSAQYYQSLHASLRRLSQAKYQVDEAWFSLRGAGEWLTQEFSQISYLALRRSGGALSRGGTVQVQLGVPILESLRAGYIKPLDLEFYRTLSQPLVRALYRQLDALHFDERSEDGLASEITVPLLGWAVRLGLFSDRPDNLLRALEPAHTELLGRRYLTVVEHSGRGKARTVRYAFAGPPATAHPELAEALMTRGVKKGMALRLSSAFPERIPLALRRFDRYLSGSLSPVYNPAGLLVAMVKSPEQYEGLEGGVSPAPSPTPVPKRGGKKAALPSQAAPQTARPLEAPTPSGPPQGGDPVVWSLTQLSVLGILKHLSTAERAALGDALSAGVLEPQALVREATAAAYQGAGGVLSLVERLRTAPALALPVVSEGSHPPPLP